MQSWLNEEIKVLSYKMCEIYILILQLSSAGLLKAGLR